MLVHLSEREARQLAFLPTPPMVLYGEGWDLSGAAACGAYGPFFSLNGFAVRHAQNVAEVTCACCLVLADQRREEGDRVLQQSDDRLLAVKSRLGGRLDP